MVDKRRMSDQSELFVRSAEQALPVKLSRATLINFFENNREFVTLDAIYKTKGGEVFFVIKRIIVFYYILKKPKQ